MCQSRPSQYLSNNESALGVHLSFNKFHVYSQSPISRQRANEELLCAHPTFFSHLYSYKMISREIRIQPARVYLAKIITEKK